MTTYKPISTDRTDVLRAKRVYGIWYGASLGFLFALFTWGLDAYTLSKMNSLYPWLKFAAGALLCTDIDNAQRRNSQLPFRLPTTNFQLPIMHPRGDAVDFWDLDPSRPRYGGFSPRS